MPRKPNMLPPPETGDTAPRVRKWAQRKKKRVTPTAKGLKDTRQMQKYQADVLSGKIPPERVRKCTGTLLDKTTGERRLCGRWAVRGATVCPRHGGSAPQVRAAAERRMRAALMPTIGRLEQLRDQNVHLPVALGAANTIINHVMGKPGQQQDKDEKKGTTVNIGTAYFNVGNRSETTTVTTEPPTAAITTTAVVSGMLEAAAPAEDVVDADVLDPDDTIDHDYLSTTAIGSDDASDDGEDDDDDSVE